LAGDVDITAVAYLPNINTMIDKYVLAVSYAVDDLLRILTDSNAKCRRTNYGV